jgi:NCAIR mutase (PurE)-related protein
LLEQVRAGKIGVEEALQEMRSSTLERLAFATLDMQRAVRRGFPEVIFGPGKSPAQVAEIVRRFRRARQTVLVTRVGPEVHRAVVEVDPKAVYHETARAITVRQGRTTRGRRGVVVVTAGTADLPVAEEACLVAELMGNKIERVFDVGVAGLHRLLEHRDTLLGARVLVVVAGMEGALPSVVAGLTDCPVIGVPTSIGYGVGAGGEAAVRAMLSSCAAGLTVVNVDNGFGAGYAAALINRRARKTVKQK